MSEVIETQFCTNCRRDILSANFVIHTVHCQRNLSLCGKCLEAVPRNQITQHNEEQHGFIYCTNCNIQVEKYKLTNHLTEECPQRKVSCKICGMQVPANNVSEHEDYCGARTEKCVDCGEYIMYKYKQLHLDSNHTFTKLHDENGPSPAWQSGKRVLANFLDFPTNSGTSAQGRTRTQHTSKISPVVHNKLKPKPELCDLSKKANDIDDSILKNLDLLTSSKVDYKQVPGTNSQRNTESGAVGRTTRTRYQQQSRPLNDTTPNQSATGAISKYSSKRQPHSSGVKVTDDRKLNNDIKSTVVHGKRNNYQPQINRKESHTNKNVKKDKNHVIDNYSNGCDSENLDRLLALQLAEDEENVSVDRLLALQLADEDDKSLAVKSVVDELQDETVTSPTRLESLLTSSTYARYNNSLSDDVDEEFLLYDTPSSSVANEEIKLPCEFCNQLVLSSNLIRHQNNCKPSSDIDQLDEMTKLPCEFCNKLFPQFRLTSHQMVCESNITRMLHNTNWKKINNTDVVDMNTTPRDTKHMNTATNDIDIHNGLDLTGSGTRSQQQARYMLHNDDSDDDDYFKRTKKM